jgi:predicted nucleotide-binding protein (sugar kinase/HSP70/actin superfamily)
MTGKDGKASKEGEERGARGEERGAKEQAVVAQPVKFVSKVPKAADEQRLIISTCEKGSVEDVTQMRGIKAGIDSIKKANPNFVEIASKDIWRARNPERVADAVPTRAWTKAAKRRVELMQRRSALRIGMPRVLNMYVYAPFFSAYFESLGIPEENLVYSDFTSGDLYREGSGRGAIDPCFPAKIGIAHVHNLLFAKHAKKRLDAIFFPMIDKLHTPLVNLQGSNACPTVTVTPETVKAAFTKEADVFKELGVVYYDPLIDFSDRKLLGQQMFQALDGLLGLSPEENEKALDVAFRELHAYEADIRRRAREVIDQLERENRVGIVVLARPYHHDPGLNHEILEEFQKLGYPVFSQSTLPLDEDLLERLFGEEVRSGALKHALDIQDVWKNSYSSSTNHKIWAAKFTARHPNLVALELSSFKCGHDAPIYTTIEGIIERSGTPYFSFKDIDENKPTGSIKIRVETIHYFLKRYVERMNEPAHNEEVERQIAEYERKLRDQLMRDQELAELAAEHRKLANRKRFLPMAGPDSTGHESSPGLSL